MLTLFFLLYVYGGDDYLVDLKVVSKTTKCRDFTVIFAVFSKMHRDFADFFYRYFLTALLICYCFVTAQINSSSRRRSRCC